MVWGAFQGGLTIGETGSENGVIMQDEEHPQGARVTLERTPGRPFSHALTCGIYGWMVHTCFLGDIEEAQSSYSRLKIAIESVLKLIPADGRADTEASRLAIDAMQRLTKEF